jgi:Exonuclease V gamma subunit
MNQYFQACYSNRTEILYEDLKERLFASTSPLAKRIVMVPSPAMKSWITLQLANDPDIGISAGIDIGLVEPSMRKIIQAVSLADTIRQSYEPSEMELALALEGAILDVCKNPHKATIEWQPLIHYLGTDAIKSKKLPKKITKRITALASALAKVFIDYGIYGANVIAEWGDDTHKGWQPLLWQKMESLFASWNYPAHKLASTSIKDDLFPEQLQIHLFGLSYFPPLYTRFLQRIAERVPVTYYLLSPCQKFWGDILSTKESLRLKSFWQQKNTTLSSQETLDLLIRDNNPLLANLGRLGREMANRMEDCCPQTTENYSLPQTILNYPQYEELASDDLILTKTDHPLTLLEAIQSDMALLRNPESGDPIPFTAYDGSIQVHAAPKKMREVEAIHDALLSIIDKHSNDSHPITPGDILVMAPDVSSYLPFIRSVFKANSEALDVQLMEPQSATRHEVVRAFLHLLAMANGRWEASAFIQLLEFPSFRNKLNLDLEDVNTIQDWIKDAKIHWGTDNIHRTELMQRDYSSDSLHEESSTGTWEDGFSRLLENLVFKPENTRNNIDFSQAELLGSILHIIRSLKEDFKPLTNGSKLSLEDWSSYLSCLLEAYFSPYDPEGSSDGYKILQEHITSFSKASNRLKDATFAFNTIQRHLEELLQKESSSYKEANLNAVRFSSLLPMRTVPAKIVVLMGMGDGEFPRQGQPKTWNLLSNNPAADYYPNTVDFDRYLFLESLLSARKYLLFSYVSQEPGNTKELGTSLLVKEVLNYLDAAYSVDNIKPSLHCCFKHALDPFDAKYFSDSTHLKSYSQSNYKAALARYCTEKSPSHSFIERFEPPTNVLDTIQNNHKIDLADLTAFAKNPLKSYLNSHGLYVDKAENRQIVDDADLFLSHLNSWQLLRDALTGSLTTTLAHAEKTGSMPKGSFNPVGRDKLISDIEVIHNKLHELNPTDTDIFPIFFNERQSIAERTEKGWILPPLFIESAEIGKIMIVGKIDLTAEQGLILLKQDKIETSIESWPLILAYASLVKINNLPLKNQVLFFKKDKFASKQIDFDSLSPLTRFVEYFLSSQNAPSPLNPDQIHLLLKDKMEKKQAAWQTESEEEMYENYDSYATWMDRNAAHADISPDHDHWSTKAKHLFASMPSKWHPRSLGKQNSGGDHADV